MKNAGLLLLLTAFMWSCTEEDATENKVAEFPETFTIDIPNTLSNSAGLGLVVQGMQMKQSREIQSTVP